MANDTIDRADLAATTLRLFSPQARGDLIDRTTVLEEFGLTSDAVASFGDTGASFSRRVLFAEVRNVLSGGGLVTISDQSGAQWTLQAFEVDGSLGRVKLESDGKAIVTGGLGAFYPDGKRRLKWFAELPGTLDLPSESYTRWTDILAARGLSDEELDKLQADVGNTPIAQSEKICDQLSKGSVDVDTFAPKSRRYYERLIGAFDGSASIIEYASGAGREKVEWYLRRDKEDGFKWALLLSGHESLTEKVDSSDLNKAELEAALFWLKDGGDKMSQIGGIEIGLRLLPSKPQLEPIVVELINQIREDSGEGGSDIEVFSCLFILVLSEIALARIFQDTPPFYRRLAALSQAALIQREIRGQNIGSPEFVDWVLGQKAQAFYIQTLIDMRQEPRWKPDFAVASQMRADFIGRIILQAGKCSDSIVSPELRTLLLERGEASIVGSEGFPFVYLPGPLEGGMESQTEVPDEIRRAVNEQLSVQKIGPGSFPALINSALLFRVDREDAVKAAEALKGSNYKLHSLADHNQLINVLLGLAGVSANTRCEELADQLRIVTRRYRYHPEHRVSVREALIICMIAAASRSEFAEWRAFLGEWMTEIALWDMSEDEAGYLEGYLKCLCYLAPDLSVSCGGAYVAAKLLNAH